ncbi:MAG: hypothetical protein AB7T49_05435 [Oligoflexales bacterium]
MTTNRFLGLQSIAICLSLFVACGKKHSSKKKPVAVEDLGEETLLVSEETTVLDLANYDKANHLVSNSRRQSVQKRFRFELDGKSKVAVFATARSAQCSGAGPTENFFIKPASVSADILGAKVVESDGRYEAEVSTQDEHILTVIVDNPGHCAFQFHFAVSIARSDSPTNQANGTVDRGIGKWEAMATVNGPQGTYLDSLVQTLWTGSELAVISKLGDELKFFDPKSNAWRASASAAEVLTERNFYTASFATLANGSQKILVFGGGDANETKRTGWIYDLETDIWTPIPSAPEGRWNASSVVGDGKMYVIGGCREEGPCSPLRYDIEGRGWEAMDDLALDDWGDFFHNRQLYWHDGKIMVTWDSFSSSPGVVLDVNSRQIAEIPVGANSPPPIGLFSQGEQYASTFHEGVLYYMGQGQGLNLATPPSTYTFDLASNTWLPRQDNPYAAVRGASLTMTSKGLLLLNPAGGQRAILFAADGTMTQTQIDGKPYLYGPIPERPVTDFYTSVWTGQELIVWGAQGNSTIGAIFRF